MSKKRTSTELELEARREEERKNKRERKRKRKRNGQKRRRVAQKVNHLLLWCDTHSLHHWTQAQENSQLESSKRGNLPSEKIVLILGHL